MPIALPPVPRCGWNDLVRIFYSPIKRSGVVTLSWNKSISGAANTLISLGGFLENTFRIMLRSAAHQLCYGEMPPSRWRAYQQLNAASAKESPEAAHAS